MSHAVNVTPHARPQHWAAAYIGRPWVLGADGPLAFDCWGLLRHVQRERYGREVPMLRVDGAVPSAEQRETIEALMRGGAWRRVETVEDGDVLQMVGQRGPHVGVVVEAGRTLGLLHAVGLREPDGRDTGSVVYTGLDRLGALGYGRLVAWRHHAAA